LVVRTEKPIPIGHLSLHAELPDMDHIRLNQGMPDGRESVLGDEPDKVLTFQVDEAVAPSQVDSVHVDPV
jgi:hypothetical protein